MGTWKKLAYQDDVITKALLTEQGDIIYASAASTPAALAHGLVTQYLKSGGHGANPLWDTPAGGAALSSKIKTSTRVLNAASGDVAYTGVGFQPTGVIAFAVSLEDYDSNSLGFSDSAKSVQGMWLYNNRTVQEHGAYLFALSAATAAPTTTGQTAIIKSYDADGFTLTWTKYGSPAARTATLYFLCLK